MSEIKYGNFRIGVFLANEHQSDQKNVTNYVRLHFSHEIVHAKNDSVIGMPENLASSRILTKMAASVFHRILSSRKYFCSYKSPIYGYLPHEETD